MRRLILILLAFLLLLNIASAQEYHVDEIIWSPDGRHFALLLSSFNEIQSQIKIYDAESLELEYELWNVTANAFHLAWSPDSQRIVTNDYGNNAYIRTLDGTLLEAFGSVIPGYDIVVEDSVWNFDASLLAELNHRSIIIRDGETAGNEQILLPDGEDTAFIDFIWSENQNILAASIFDNKILIIDAISQTVLQEIATSEPVFFHAWHDNHFYVQYAHLTHITDAEYRYLYQIWDSETGELLDEFEIEDWDSIWDTQFSMDASLLLIKRATGIVEIWDVATWTSQQSQQFPVTTLVSLSPDNTKLLVVNSAEDLSYLDLPLTEE